MYLFLYPKVNFETKVNSRAKKKLEQKDNRFRPRIGTQTKSIPRYVGESTSESIDAKHVTSPLRQAVEAQMISMWTRDTNLFVYILDIRQRLRITWHVPLKGSNDSK